MARELSEMKSALYRQLFTSAVRRNYLATH
jgi:hypothetical protein